MEVARADEQQADDDVQLEQAHVRAPYRRRDSRETHLPVPKTRMESSAMNRLTTNDAILKTRAWPRAEIGYSSARTCSTSQLAQR